MDIEERVKVLKESESLKGLNTIINDMYKGKARVVTNISALKAFRDKIFLSNQDLADLLGVGINRVKNIMNGNVINITFDELQVFSDLDDKFDIKEYIKVIKSDDPFDKIKVDEVKQVIERMLTDVEVLKVTNRKTSRKNLDKIKSRTNSMPRKNSKPKAMILPPEDTVYLNDEFNIGERLVKAVEASEYTSSEFSRLIGRHQSYIRSLKQQRSVKMSKKLLKKACVLLGVKYEEFINTLEEPMETAESVAQTTEVFVPNETAEQVTAEKTEPAAMSVKTIEENTKQKTASASFMEKFIKSSNNETTVAKIENLSIEEFVFEGKDESISKLSPLKKHYLVNAIKAFIMNETA